MEYKQAQGFSCAIEQEKILFSRSEKRNNYVTAA